MSMLFFTYQARTRARMGAEILRQAGIPVRLDRTPSSLAKNGCGYGLWVPEEHGGPASALLQEKGGGFVRSYRFRDGQAREVRL